MKFIALLSTRVETREMPSVLRLLYTMSEQFYLACRKAISSRLSLIFQAPLSAGKITILAVLGSAFVTVVGFGFFFEARVPTANAANVATTLTVLNTPPTWTVDAEESTESSTTTPTNAGSVITWIGTADDSNLDSYFLLICKTNATPTAVANGTPSCGGGIGNRWAASATTTSGSQASAATTTKETFPFQNESNNWYAWICDANSSGPQCNQTFKQGNGDVGRSSPFVVNHPPVFNSISNNSPAIPGGSITWSTVAHDNDVIRGGDTVKLYVCKVSDFTGSACGAGGTWAASTFATTSPATTTPILIPTQDNNYNAFVFLTDNNNLVATSTNEGANSAFTITNVAPTLSAATISLIDPRTATTTGLLTLFVPQSTSGPFFVKFSVTDNNSCLNASSTAEISLATTSVYRSGVTQSGCQTTGNFNTNRCYPSIEPQTNIVCFQATSTNTYSIASNACDGATESTVDWFCSVPLWYNADPTDGSTASDTPFFSQNWLASVQVVDDDSATSTLTEASTGNDLVSFLAFGVTQSSISFGGLQPGEKNDPLATTTDLRALGNVGLDESLYGSTMCTNWSALGGATNPDACDIGGINPASEIAVANQKFATSSVGYASSTAYTLTSSSSPSSLAINVQKTIATSSPQQKNTWWGIQIPLTITLAGNYTGQNTITATKSDPSLW